MSAETSTTSDKSSKHNGQSKGKTPRVLTNPRDVAGLIMMQIDNVNARKDDLTIAIKGLADTTKQLVRAYAQQQAAIEKLGKRVMKLEKDVNR